MYIVFTNHKEEALLGRPLYFPCVEIVTNLVVLILSSRISNFANVFNSAKST